MRTTKEQSRLETCDCRARMQGTEKLLLLWKNLHNYTRNVFCWCVKSQNLIIARSQEIAGAWQGFIKYITYVYVTMMCRNDELSLTMSWVGCLLKDSELFVLFSENSQTLLKISVIPILLTFIDLVALSLVLNNQLNSSLGHLNLTLIFCYSLF